MQRQWKKIDLTLKLNLFLTIQIAKIVKDPQRPIDCATDKKGLTRKIIPQKTVKESKRVKMYQIYKLTTSKVA